MQLVFAFQTRGAPNGMATSVLAKRATELVAASGLFSEVSSSPVPGGAVLSITVNNVSEDVTRNGVTSGLTFGSVVAASADFYIATAQYTPGPGAAAITVERKHLIHSVTDPAGVPEGITPAKSFDEAFATMARQLFDHTLNDLARDPSFQSGAARSQQAAAGSS